MYLRCMSRYLFLLSFLFGWICSSAQDEFQWWDNIHNWQGQGPREFSIVLSPKFMGPNALTPQRALSGKINPSTLEQGMYAHLATGDLTSNLFSRLQVSLFDDLVAFESFIVPIEYYRMTDEVRDKRRALDRDGQGIAGGDFYFNSLIQILKDRPKGPDLLLRFGFKTASGTNLDAARYTDTPGYHFDLSAGWQLNEEFRWATSIGFMAWQTFSAVNPQDDAFTYASRLDYTQGKWLLNLNMRGYVGYLNNGDRPLLLQLESERALSDCLKVYLNLQQGIWDYPFTSVGVGLRYIPEI